MFVYLLVIFTFFIFLSILMVIISLELTRVNPDRNIFSINVELTSTFFTQQRFGPSPSPNFKSSNNIHLITFNLLIFQWHPNCFVCKECNSPFNDGAFFEHDGFPYCETHYHALRGSLCAGCHKVGILHFLTFFYYIYLSTYFIYFTHSIRRTFLSIFF